MNLGFLLTIMGSAAIILHLITGHTGEIFMHTVKYTILSLLCGIIKYFYVKHKQKE